MKFLAEQYCDDVLSGRQVACKWIRLACERHRRDLEWAERREWGLWFDERAAKVAIAFFGVLRHSKGEWAGRPVELEPWQQFHLWQLFGWKRENGTRRFRTSYLEVARKNGKSTMAAGVGLYLLTADGEPGAEVYSAATKKDQAKITHSEATRMVARSPQLRKIVTARRDNLHVFSTASKYEPLGRDADTMDGLNVHGAIVDEVHAHKTPDVWDMLETATGARREPLIFAITTAGFDRFSLCFELHDYAQKVVGGVVEDDSFLGLVYTLDEEDGEDWENEENWVKANPNLGVSKKWEDMRRLAARAKEMPSRLNIFKRMHLNLWTQVAERWIDPEKWRLCAGPVSAGGPLEEMLRGRRCHGGLDLATTTDIAAWVLVFEPTVDDPLYYVLARFFCPEEAIRERSRNDRVPYDLWVEQGWLTATPGAVIDYDFIYDQIARDAEDYDVVDVAFDRWGSTKIVTGLMEMGGEEWVVQFGQGFASMNAPMKELETLVLGQGIAHGGNPVLSWMADNVVARVDPAGNIKPDKSRSREKIDGVIGLVMGLDRTVRYVESREESVYERRGLREV